MINIGCGWFVAPIVGGIANDGTAAGLGCVVTIYGAAVTNGNIGSRLCCFGN